MLLVKFLIFTTSHLNFLTQEYNIVYLTKPKDGVVFANGQSAVSFREELLQRNSCSPEKSLRSSHIGPQEVQVLQIQKSLVLRCKHAGLPTGLI